MRWLLVVTVLILAASGTALAAGIDKVKELQDQGDFMESAALGERLGTAEGFAWAANAYAIHGYYFAPEAERADALRQAVRMANLAKRRARRAGITNKRLLAFIVFQQGQALGRLAEVLPRRQRSEYAVPARDAFQEVLEIDKKRWEANMGLARWHVRTMFANKGGVLGIGGLFTNLFDSASFKQGEEFRAAAVEQKKSPAGQKTALYESARLRLIIDPEANGEAATMDLKRSLAFQPTSALTRLIDDRARGCLDDLEGCAERLRTGVLE